MVDPKFVLEHIEKKKILIAALDWGMGHTTRCVALIHQLFEQGNDVIFAGSQQQCDFMKSDFPNLKTVFLEGYNVHWDGRKSSYLQMARQQRSIFSAIRKEKKWVKGFLSENEVDLIISDNRYGFKDEEVTSIFLTHQLCLQLPYFRGLVNAWLRKQINRFDACWVPDTEDRPLTHELSRSTGIKIPVHYVGWLNRFGTLPNLEVEYDFLIICSGPEPERSRFFEALIKKYTESSDHKVAVVGMEYSGVSSFIHPSTSELKELISQSEVVVSRAGYTTIMELISTGKKGILYPTKGQYEQVYLARVIAHPLIQFEISVS